MDEWIVPRYEGLSIANIAPTIVRALAGSATETALPGLHPEVLPTDLLDGVRRVVLLIVDALGDGQLRAALEVGVCPGLAARRAAGALWHGQLTSAFPSSTCSALTSLHTGVRPIDHGVLGLNVYVPEVGQVADVLDWCRPADGGPLPAGLDPDTFVAAPSLHRLLADAGRGGVVLLPAPLIRSPLARMQTGGATVLPCLSISDMLVGVRELLEAGSPPALITAYWPMVDSLAHRYGPGGDTFHAELAMLDHGLARELLAPARQPATLLLITADHGQRRTDPARAVALNDHPDLLAMLAAPPSGERRFLYLHVRAGLGGAALAYARQAFADVATVLDREEAFAAGLFGAGPADAAHAGRVGDVVLIARADWQIGYAARAGSRPVAKRGSHGGLSPAEMLVPLLALRLG